MTAKDFLNFKKPHFWCALLGVAVLGYAGVVGVLDQEVPQPPVEETVNEEVHVEFEEEGKDEPVKTDSQIIMERFRNIDWNEVQNQAKKFGEEGWEKGIVLLAELPEDGIRLYGYNDTEYQYRGVAVDHNDNVNYFDWVYMNEKHISPEIYWNEADKQLQVTLNVSDDTGVNAEELHVLVEHHTMTMEDFIFRSEDYLAEVEEQLTGTGMNLGKYADIQLGKKMMLKFTPVLIAEGTEIAQEVHQVEILLKPSKDGFTFELGSVGVKPQERKVVLKVKDKEETYTEIQYISADGFSVWHPENMQPISQFGHEGFALMDENGERIVQIIIVSESEIEVDDAYLKEAVGNFKSSGAYKKVTVGKIQKLQAEAKDVTIKTIEVVHDNTVDRFYAVKGKEQTLLVTVSMTVEAMESVGARIDQMMKGITFEKPANKE